jgi:hypothetical protein
MRVKGIKEIIYSAREKFWDSNIVSIFLDLNGIDNR